MLIVIFLFSLCVFLYSVCLYDLLFGLLTTRLKPGIQRVQALAYISRSVLCCRSNETTRAPIANPPNSAQLEGTPYHSPKLHRGSCSSVGIEGQTDRHTQILVFEFVCVFVFAFIFRHFY